MGLFPHMERSYIESLHSPISSLQAGYRRAVLGTTNYLSNGTSKLVPNIPVGPNRNAPFHLMYMYLAKLPEFWVEWQTVESARNFGFKRSFSAKGLGRVLKWSTTRSESCAFFCYFRLFILSFATRHLR